MLTKIRVAEFALVWLLALGVLNSAAMAETSRSEIAQAKALVKNHLPADRVMGEPINGGRLFGEALAAKRVGAQSAPVVIPVFPITAAPNQPQIVPNDTRGIINALCEVQLYIVGCPFFPNAATLACDSNGDGIDDMVMQLTDVRILNANLVRVTLPRLSPQLPGTAFSLSCCGGLATLTLLQKVNAADNNVFGDYTAKLSIEIELGRRAPVVISASPSNVNCAIAQNLQIPGSCFLFPDGTGNVTEVFAVEVGNPTNVIEASRFVVLTSHLIDALFEFGAANVGKEFLIFVSGPNGASRNLTSLPSLAPANCPLGNEQGIRVTVTCDAAPPDGGGLSPPPPFATVTNCQLSRTDAGGWTLTLLGSNFRQGATVLIGGVTPKKIKFKEPDEGNSGAFRRLVLKGRVCSGLPGVIVISTPGVGQGPGFQCNQSCSF